MLLGIAAVLISALFLAGVVAYKRLTSIYSTSLYTEFPHEPGSSHFLGVWNDIKKNMHDPAAFTLQNVAKHGEFYTMRLIHMNRLVTVNLDALKHILVGNPYNWVKAPMAVFLLEQLLGRGLLTYEGNDHAYHRKICQPAFSFSSVNSMVPIFDARAESLVKLWQSQLNAEGSTKVIVLSDMSRLTFDVLCEAVFGVNLDSIADKDSRYAKMFTGLLHGLGLSVFNFIPFLRALPTPQKRTRETSRRDLETELLLPIVKKKRATLVAARDNFIRKNVAGEVEDGEEGDVSFYGDKLDLLDRLIVVTLESAQLGVELTDEQLMGHIMTFAFAGHETSSNGLAWTFYALGKAPEVEKKLRAEVEEVLGDKEVVTLADVEKMPYLNNVLKESLRLHPPVSFTVREAIADDELCGHPVPAGTVVSIPIAAIHRLPQYWDRPNDFWPERWDSKTVNHNAWMPFISGPKSCIGNRVALVEMKVVLAKVMQRFNFVMDSDYHPIKKTTITTRPEPAGPPLTLTMASGGWKAK